MIGNGSQTHSGYPRNRETGKMANKNSMQGKLREFENFAKLGKLREFQYDICLNLLIIILLNYMYMYVMHACVGKFNVLTICLPTFSRECTSFNIT